jgi:hypothetical protein
MSRRVQRLILVLHGVITCAAAIVLAVFPAAIPATVGVPLEPREYLLSYFLAAAELGIGLLSVGAARLDDQRAVQMIGATFAAFHGATAVLEVIYLAMEGGSAVLFANVVVRVIAAATFLLLARSRRA